MTNNTTNSKFEEENKIMIRVIALVRSLAGKDWAKVVEFEDMDGELKKLNIPFQTLLDARELKKLLASNGFNFNLLTNELIKYIQNEAPKKRIRTLNKTGWVNEQDFVCPSFTVKTSKDNEEYELQRSGKHGFAQKGTLQEWRVEICKLCEGNTILTLALCASLLGTGIECLGIGNTIINLVGQSSIGKTTALRVAASVWGEPKNFINQWRSTSNALEATAQTYNETVLILDELGQCQAKDVGEIVYMIGNAKGKSRLNQYAELKQNKEWRLAVLSSGEVAITDKIMEAGGKVKAGQLVRCTDIDCHMSEENGIYDTMHDDFENGADLSKYLNEQCSKYYGVVAEAFVRKLAIMSDESIKSKFNELRGEIKTKFKLANANGQVLRVADVFAALALVGVLACEFKIFTHRVFRPSEDQEMIYEIKDLIFQVFERWLTARGTTQAVEDGAIVEHIKSFLFQSDNRFHQIERKDGKVTNESQFTINNRLGYCVKDYYDSRLKEVTYYFLSGVFSSEVCKGYNERIAKNTLKKKGLLVLDKDGSNPKAPAYVKEMAGKRVVTIVIKHEEENSGS